MSRLAQSFPPTPPHLTEELLGFHCLVAAPEDTSLWSQQLLSKACRTPGKGGTALDILLKPRS